MTSITVSFATARKTGMKEERDPAAVELLLRLVRAVYKELESQVEFASTRPAKSDLVMRTVLVQMEEFTLADLSAQLPTASRQLTKSARPPQDRR